MAGQLSYEITRERSAPNGTPFRPSKPAKSFALSQRAKWYATLLLPGNRPRNIQDI